MSVPTNRLLDGLPRDERDRLKELYEPMRLVAGSTLCRAGGPITHAIFPHSGVISIVAGGDEDAILELTLLGREGFFGVPLALGAGLTSDCGAIVQADGHGARFDARRFAALVDEMPALRKRVHRYTRELLHQLSRTAICNTFHSIEQRTARWVLTMADRLHAKEIRMTQAFLADMLGVRRPAVSHAASRLLEDGLIDYSRGILEVLDRAGLEKAACECYRLTTIGRPTPIEGKSSSEEKLR